MIKIAPSILAVKDLSRLQGKIKAVEQAGAAMIHIDAMDGLFVANKTPYLDPAITKQIKSYTPVPLDAHLMVQMPEKHVPGFIDAGADSITIHAEATGALQTILKQIRAEGRKAAIAINPETPTARITHLLDHVDMVLIMSVHPGKGGQAYIDAVNEKIAAIRKHNPDIEIEVDGGIKVENAHIPINAGASILVSGTGIFNKENYKEAIDKMKDAMLIGADHAGFALKEKIKAFLHEKGIAYQDIGPASEERCDYPDFAKKVAEPISKGTAKQGILICGTGIGMSIAANRFPNVRAGHVSSVQEAEMTKKHNDANILCLGSRIIDEETAKRCVEAWLNSEFEGGRHQQRIEKINL